ncbi:hypothetical protein EJ04DRAFT_450350 [Polyplosphaeria fusca]|uniref:polynucleotide adenylyltransferase n=1 Tax=Polyplosphaeria fusca TaxID=682080 RepID=A0A9P4QM20_9PLEO|nr:hypothetical protein EJ04DRAFT_450350 [Polyplosphaeria fusca]
MGELQPGESTARYPYFVHPFAIHSDSRRTSERISPRARHTLDNRPLPLLHSPHLDHTSPFLLIHPLFDNPHASASLAAPFPTVIVSPHFEPPTAARDYLRPVVKKPLTESSPTGGTLDGKNTAPAGVNSSAPSMTSNGVQNTGGKRSEGTMESHARRQRPSIVSQLSNSVPSTPLQLARHESRSRSPSPNGGLGSHSPRSVSSEANGHMTTLRKPAQRGCKYETNAAFGRRRIPYTSSDLLDKAKEEPKKNLDPHEDDKLSGDMRELYDRLLPTAESANRRIGFVKKLENILTTEWPGKEFKVHVFGSSGNLLYTNDSDVDICIQTSYKRLEEMHMLAEALAKHGMEKVVCVPGAKVRIVKVWDPELNLACDMNVNNTLAIQNTRMIKTYVEIDDRVRELAMIVKYWTKQRILNDAALGGTISSYTWICMILNFLQTREPPIIPSLHKLGDQYRKAKQDGQMASDNDFADDLDKLKGFGKSNRETLGGLLFHFFRRYGHEIDYEKHVISVREGRLVTREEKGWDLKSLKKEARNRLCVEEPFSTDRNLGNSADEFAWRGIHLEIRRAFDLLADDRQLLKLCEQYEFPPEEKTVFKKPTASVKPTLTSSAPSMRGGRGGSSHRGGRGGPNQKANYGRRASSGATFAPNRPLLQSPPIGGMPNQREYFPGRPINEHFADQLVHQYQVLEMQSNTLRAQLVAHHRAQQAQQVLHAQAIAQAQAQAQNRGPNSSPQKSPFVNGRSSPRLSEVPMVLTHVPPQFLYHYPSSFDQNSGSVTGSVPPDGPRTNPSSPSLTNSVPGLRRTVHRSSNASDSVSLRSQSQPPRAVPPTALPPGYLQTPQFFDPSTFAGYPIARSTQDTSGSQTTSEAPYSPRSGYTESAVSSNHSTPKEYVGYYVADHPHAQPQPRVQPQIYSVPQIPSYSEVQQRRKRVSPEITQPLLNTALRRVSRSPSPLGGHVRSYSTSVTPPLGSASSAAKKDRIDSIQYPKDNGPVIANGSFPTQPRESRTRSETVDAFLPADPANPAAALGIYISNSEPYQLTTTEQHQQMIFDEIQRQKQAEFIQAGAANGSVSNTSPVDSNSNLTRVTSGGKQPFPSLPETWMGYETSTDNQPDISPTHMQPPQWRTPLYTNGLSPLDTINTHRIPPQEIQSAGVKSTVLLSPVHETRTPSPTASRQSEHKLTNGNKSQTKENQPQRRASHTPSTGNKDTGRGAQQKGNVQANDGGGKSNTNSTNTASSWNTTQRRKKKKTKQIDAKSTGEPLPANVADRKGG